MGNKEQIGKRNYSKERVALRYWLLGREYHKALRAMEFAEKFHQGVRKDGVTPEFAHQVEIALYVQTLEKYLLYPEDTLCAVFLHDVPEDYDVDLDKIENEFGTRVRRAVWALTKKFQGFDKASRQTFEEQARDPIASIVKGADRSHNVQTMIGVFTKEKQADYIKYAEKWILPMMKKARRKFPEQTPAYENIKHLLTSQISLIRATGVDEAEDES